MGQAMPDGIVATICNNQRETPNTTINETTNGITLLKKSQLYYHSVMLQDAGEKNNAYTTKGKGNQPPSLQYTTNGRAQQCTGTPIVARNKVECGKH